MYALIWQFEEVCLAQSRPPQCVSMCTCACLCMCMYVCICIRDCVMCVLMLTCARILPHNHTNSHSTATHACKQRHENILNDSCRLTQTVSMGAGQLSSAELARLSCLEDPSTSILSLPLALSIPWFGLLLPPLLLAALRAASLAGASSPFSTLVSPRLALCAAGPVAWHALVALAPCKSLVPSRGSAFEEQAPRLLSALGGRLGDVDAATVGSDACVLASSSNGSCRGFLGSECEESLEWACAPGNAACVGS
jgi:hypothetical protein